jgi:hypothetical protein
MDKFLPIPDAESLPLNRMALIKASLCAFELSFGVPLCRIGLTVSPFVQDRSHLAM